MSLLAGCASVPTADPALDAAAKALTPPAGMGSIYVCRGGGVGTALRFQLAVDGLTKGALAPGTYQWITVAPGEHSIVASGSENSAEVKVTVEAGKNYFFRMGVNMGVMTGRVRLDPIPEDEGRERVAKSKLADPNAK